MCSSFFNSCGQTGRTLGKWYLLTHNQVTESSSSAQSSLGPPIYSRTRLLPVPHSCLWVRAGSSIPSNWTPFNGLISIPASSSPSEDTTAPPCFLLMDHTPWQTTGRSMSCCWTHLCCAREPTAQYELGLLQWVNFWNKRKKWSSLEFRYNSISLKTQSGIT